MSRAPSPIVLASFLAASVARAAPAGESVHVTYDAPSGCPTGEQFVAEVQARTIRAAVALDPEPAPLRIAVSISVADGASSGRLQIRDTEGRETVRAVEGDTCSEVASALVLVAALAIDPNATMSALPPAAPEPPPPAPREESVPPAADTAGVGDGSGERDHAPRGSAAAAAAAVGGIAPSVLVGASVALGFTLHLGAASPVLRLGFAEASGGERSTSAPTASFTWRSGTFEGCPHRFKVAGLYLEPCLRFEAGDVNAVGANVVPARGTSLAWLAVGAAGRAEWPIVEPLFVELEAGARVPLVQSRYVFEPDSEYYRAPLVAGFASAGVGVHFL